MLRRQAWFALCRRGQGEPGQKCSKLFGRTYMVKALLVLNKLAVNQVTVVLLFWQRFQ